MSDAQPTPETKRAYTAAHFLLELDQEQIAGYFRSVEGGSISAEVMTYQSGQNYDLWRQVGKPKAEDIKLQIGMSMSKDFYLWIEDFFTGKPTRKSGAICALDFNYKERARREFFHTMISEIGFPKLDASDKSAAYLTVTLVPEELKFAEGSGKQFKEKLGEKQKLWTCANFEFTLDGFEDACSRVTKVDGFNIKQKVHEYHAGNQRWPLKVPGFVEFPELAFYVPETDIKVFADHVHKRIVKGEPAPDARLTGAITMNDQSGAELCRVDLFGCEIKSVGPEKLDAQSDDMKLVKVQLAVESMKFDYLRGEGLE